LNGGNSKTMVNVVPNGCGYQQEFGRQIIEHFVNASGNSFTPRIFAQLYGGFFGVCDADATAIFQAKINAFDPIAGQKVMVFLTPERGDLLLTRNLRHVGVVQTLAENGNGAPLRSGCRVTPMQSGKQASHTQGKVIRVG
jgi:hypothetical protein